MRRIVASALAALLLAGCGDSSTVVDDLLAGRKIDYQQEGEKQRALQYPPDLIAAGGGVEGTVSLSEYTIESVPDLDDAEIVPDAPTPAVKLFYRRAGNTRWVEAMASAEEIWPRARAFWADELGFPLKEEKPRLGVMETDWLNLQRRRIPAPGLRAYLDELFGVFRDSGDRDRFLTRVERNDSGGVDIFVTHRRVIARFSGDGFFSGYESAPNEDQLEVEMLRRLMLYLGRVGEEDIAEREDVNQQVTIGEEVGGREDYEYVNDKLIIHKPFLESWRIVQIGLDRGGFSIEDRDFQEGVIYIRHSGGPESDEIFGKVETGFFNKLFSDERPILRDLRMTLKTDEENFTVVSVAAVEGDDPLTDLQAAVVMELLYERLP